MSISLILIVFLGVIFPWLVRNHKITGEWMVSSMQKKVLNWYHIQSTHSKLIDKNQDDSKANESPSFNKSYESGAAENKNPTNAFQIIAGTSGKYMASMALFFVMPTGADFLRLSTGDFFRYNRGDLFSRPFEVLKTAFREIKFAQWMEIAFSFVWLMFIDTAMVIGIYLLIKRKERCVATALLTIIIYFVMATGVAFTARFRVPILPYMILLSSYGMITRLRMIRNKRRNFKY